MFSFLSRGLDDPNPKKQVEIPKEEKKEEEEQNHYAELDKRRKALKFKFKKGEIVEHVLGFKALIEMSDAVYEESEDRFIKWYKIKAYSENSKRMFRESDVYEEELRKLKK